MLASEFFREFKPEHVDQVELMEAYGDQKISRENFLRGVSLGCPAYSLVVPDTDTALACFGAHSLYDGVMECWALVSRDVDKYSHYYAKQTKLLMNWFFEKQNLRRMQIFIRADQEWARRWAYYLEFELEGRLKNYGEDNHDYFLFAKVRNA
jgi:hypothetical protein